MNKKSKKPIEELIHQLVIHLGEDPKRIDLFFEATRWRGEIVNAEPDKCNDLSWFPMNALPENMLPFVKEVVTDAFHESNYSEYS